MTNEEERKRGATTAQTTTVGGAVGARSNGSLINNKQSGSGAGGGAGVGAGANTGGGARAVCAVRARQREESERHEEITEMLRHRLQQQRRLSRSLSQSQIQIQTQRQECDERADEYNSAPRNKDNKNTANNNNNNNNNKQNSKNKRDNNNEERDRYTAEHARRTSGTVTVNSEREWRSVVVDGKLFDRVPHEVEVEEKVEGDARDVTAIERSSASGAPNRQNDAPDETRDEREECGRVLTEVGNFHTYENLNLHELQLSKKYLLQRYFRSALEHSEQSQQLPTKSTASSDYENVCRGCGYGVFEARGPLCHFCECLVHGVRAVEAAEAGEAAPSVAPSDTDTVYENVCSRCARLTSGGTSAEQGCKCHHEAVVGCEKEPPPPSGKREKRGLFHGLIGSLKRARKGTGGANRTPCSPLVSQRRPQIEHNVDGYENVFCTRDTFDLQRICELKRSKQSSCSDQHIYGRLKLPETSESSSTLPTQLSLSHDQLLQQAGSADALCVEEIASESGVQQQQPKEKGKRPRLSRTRLLFTRTPAKPSGNTAKPKGTPLPSPPPLPLPQPTELPVKQSLYLRDSVCHWMTSLRRELHSYHDPDIALCHPKSVPPKHSYSHSYSYCPSGSGCLAPAPAPLTKCVNIDSSTAERKTLKKKKHEAPAETDDRTNSLVSLASVVSSRGSSGSSSSGVALRRPAPQQSQRGREFEDEERDGDSEDPCRSHVERMVHEFKCNLLARQMQQQQQSSSAAQMRTKRQAIYLKPNDDQFKIIQNKNNSTNSGGSGETLDAHSSANVVVVADVCAADSDSDVNCNRKQTNNRNDNRTNNNDHNPTASQFVENAVAAAAAVECSASAAALAIRRTVRQGITSSSALGKRCGIYERDSEFVNDILSAFETFLQRDTSSATATETRAEVVNDSGAIADREQLLAIDSAGVIGGDPISCASQRREQREGPQVERIDGALQVFPARSIEPTRRFSLDILQLIERQLISLGLNRVVICGVDQPLRVFLSRISENRRAGGKYASWTEERLVRTFRRLNAAWRRSIAEKPRLPANSDSVVESNARITMLSVVEVSDVIDATSSDNYKTLKERKDSTENERIAGEEDHLMVVATRGSESGSNRHCSEEHMRSNGEKYSSDTRTQVPKKCLGAKEVITSDRVSSVVAGDDDHPTGSATNASESTTHLEALKSNRPNRFCCENRTRTNSAKHSSDPPPQVPARDPKTTITSAGASPPLPSKRQSPVAPARIKMTVPTANSTPTFDKKITLTKRMGQVVADDADEEESIYQPIWKFKTVGEVQERYHTDADYYEIGGNDACAAAKSRLTGDDSSMSLHDEVEDHGEWETDDEFMFTTQLDNCSLNSSTIRSMSSAGSTITGFGSSTATLPSAVSVSLTHHLLRNVGIFYSVSEPRLRAIVYEYDRVHASTYFARAPTASASHANDSVIVNGSPLSAERSPVPPPRTTSAAAKGTTSAVGGRESGCRSAKVAGPAPASNLHLLPDSVQAWKFMLLDVHYLEDEEDMIVSETEILRAQEIKEDIDSRQTQQLSILQRFKSASIGNLIDLPTEDDKKSIAERMRNKLQRGVFKLNVRSPKSEKKSRGIFRRAEATSLYLEDGMKPKYPIFGAPLEQLELNQTTHPHVPRFVVDCVEYIERRECINQDGLYRASGNKVCIDELKQKLSESYIYDPKLLVTDDIHTLTSLLKLFFRELGAPLIPQETYERLAVTLTDAAGIESLRLAFETMREPNLSTLKFLIKHLTNVAACSAENRMPASNLAIVWGPCILSVNQIDFDIGRMNTLAKVLIENYERVFSEHERLVS